MSWEPKERRTTLLEHVYSDGSGCVYVEDRPGIPGKKLIAVHAFHAFDSGLVKTLGHAVANAVYTVGSLQEGDWQPLFNVFMTAVIQTGNHLSKAENPLDEFEWILRVASSEDEGSSIMSNLLDDNDSTEVL